MMNVTNIIDGFAKGVGDGITAVFKLDFAFLFITVVIALAIFATFLAMRHSTEMVKGYFKRKDEGSKIKLEGAVEVTK